MMTNMAMSDEILARELGKIPKLMGSIINPELSGKQREPDQNLTVKVSPMLPDNTYEEEFDINLSAPDSLKLIFAVLSKEGRIIEEVSSGLYPTLSAIIPSGFLGMNPAIVSVIIMNASSSKSHIVVRGIAKEGIIKQYAGKKAAQKIILAIRQ